MEIKNSVEAPITIINPGNGLPDVSPCSFVPIWIDIGGSGGGHSGGGVPPINPIPDPHPDQHF